jgi:hypothetical protein
VPCRERTRRAAAPQLAVDPLAVGMQAHMAHRQQRLERPRLGEQLV